MLVVALTGGIGSGKTTVSEIFKSKNIPVIDTDVIAREIVGKDKPAYFEIIHLFGDGIINRDKTIDRNVLRKAIFSSNTKRQQLENVLHPLIWDEVKSQLSLLTENASTSAAYSYCIIVVPLLIENLSQINTVKFDRILVVDVPEELQIQRTKKRDNSGETVIKNIIKSQASRQDRLDAADDIILNTNNLGLLSDEVEKIHQQYLQLSK